LPSKKKSVQPANKPNIPIDGAKKRIVAIIPARIGSEEVHAKVLKDLGGKPVIQHVYEKVKASGLFDEIICAVDHEKIMEAVKNFGGIAVMTRKDHICGSDRCAEAAKNIKADIFVNVQADEPFLNPKMLPEVIEPLIKDPTISMATLCCEFQEKAASENIFNVKVVKSAKSGKALYFSRSLIPYARKPGIIPHYQHIGVYAFQAAALQQYAAFNPSSLELREGLEQLRALENGISIQVVETKQDYKRIAINTAEDLEKARKLL
jgi:3-deoxy-manno-octulosonate cytidylyltransferase (CMP-KDO synthetase)